MTRQEFLTALPELVANYQPSPDVLAQISQVSLLMMVGPSGVGKSSLINRLQLPFVPSHVTRPAREGERNGEDFHFMNDYSDALRQIKDRTFVQIVVGVSGDLYGTKASSYPTEGFAVMPVLADAVPHFRKLGFKETLSAFITPPSFEEWQRRMRTHNLSQDQLKKRLSEGKRSLQFALSDNQTHMILNDDLGSALAQLNGLISGDIDNAMEKAAKEAAENILNKLDLVNA